MARPRPHVKTGSGPTRLLSVDAGDSFPIPRVKRPGCGTDYFPPKSAGGSRKTGAATPGRSRLRVGCSGNRFSTTCKMAEAAFVNGVLSTDMTCVVFLR
jgi:hypothetical protein